MFDHLRPLCALTYGYDCARVCLRFCVFVACTVRVCMPVFGPPSVPTRPFLRILSPSTPHSIVTNQPVTTHELPCPPRLPLPKHVFWEIMCI